MRIAYCVMCHKYTPVLRELVALSVKGNDIFIHVDKKSDISDFKPLEDSVNFIEPRIDVTWGTYSQIEASLQLFDAARESKCDYIAFISGDTLPLRSDAEIKSYLWANLGNEFIYEEPLQLCHTDRLRYKYPAGRSTDISLRSRVARSIIRGLKLLPKNKYYDTLPALSFGTNWLVITPAFRDYIFEFLGANPEYTEAFRWSFCGDELFFATILDNSPFADKRDARRYMYADWETGPQSPRTLDESDFGRMQAAAAKDDESEFYLFARKFSENIDLDEYREKIISNSVKHISR